MGSKFVLFQTHGFLWRKLRKPEKLWGILIIFYHEVGNAESLLFCVSVAANRTCTYKFHEEGTGSFILTDAEAPHFTHVSPEIGKGQVVIEILAPGI